MWSKHLPVTTYASLQLSRLIKCISVQFWMLNPDEKRHDKLKVTSLCLTSLQTLVIISTVQETVLTPIQPNSCDGVGVWDE